MRPRTLTHAAAITYATNVGAALLSLLNVLAIARSLGPDGRGQTAFLIAVTMLTSHLVSLSLQEANANMGAADPEARPALATNSVIFSLLLGVIAAVVVGGLAHAVPAIGGDAGPALLWFALASTPIAILKQYLTLLVQADYAFGVTNVSWIAGPLTTAICNGLLAALGAITITSAFAAWVAGQALGLGVVCFYVARHAGFGRPDRALARRMVSFGAKAHVSRLMEIGNYRGDQWLMGATVGPRELGLYSIAVAWAELLFYLPGVLVLIQRPDLVRAGRQEAVRRAARVCRAGFVVSGIAAVGLVLAAPLLCTGVFGSRFGGSVDDLRILAFGAWGIVAFELLRNALTAQGKPMHGSAAVGVAFVLTVALDLLLIPAHGGVGAAVATTVAYTCGGVAAAVVFRLTLDGRLLDLAPRVDDLAWLVRKALLLTSWRGVR